MKTPSLNARELMQEFARLTLLWHESEPGSGAKDETAWQLHLANFTLWHLEDRARDPHAKDSTIAHVKRSIDTANQRRNDLVEQFDTELLRLLAASGLPVASAPLHSETPGLIADRLSILSLKIFHTREQADRIDASPAHRERNSQRLLVLEQQNNDLAGCLSELWDAVCQGMRRYKLYRQMKMYNDPELNPVLYAGPVKEADRGGA